VNWCKNILAKRATEFLANYFDPVTVSWKDYEKQTLLHLACVQGYANVVELLLEHTNIEVNQCDEHGYTALQRACQQFNCCWEYGRKNPHISSKIITRFLQNYMTCIEYILASKKATVIPSHTICDETSVLSTLLKDYHENPKELVCRLRIKLGLNNIDAASTYLDISLLNEGYFKLITLNGLGNGNKFYKIMQLLPLELQMLVCSHLYQVKTQFISSVLISRELTKFVLYK
jgi:hypothetical protein